MKNQNPAQESQSPEITFMESRLQDFADFVIDSMAEGHHENFDDHFAFMKAALEEYIESEIEDFS